MIKHAAIKFKGKIFTGSTHENVVIKIFKKTKLYPKYNEIQKGFLDQEGNFYDRRIAYNAAKKAGQLKRESPNGELYSDIIDLEE